MASVIDQAIPDQAFEILRDRIGLILAEELAVQHVLKSLPGTTPKVFVERFAQIDATECPVINVMLDRGDYDNQDPTTARGTFNFSVDVYTTAASKTGGVRGDAASVIGLHKLMGICRAIIQDARYIRLGFDPGFVMRRQVTSIQIADQTKSKDVNNAVMGRLNVLVAAPEVSGFDTALAIGGFDTQVKLHSTELGYVFSGDDFPAPPITGSEIKVNGAFLIDLQCGDLLSISVINSTGDDVGQIINQETVLVRNSIAKLVDSLDNLIEAKEIAAEGEEKLIAPDNEATVNSTPYATVPSGTPIDVDVEDTAGADVGSLVGGKWQIANATVENSNSTVSVSVEAEGSDVFPDTPIKANGDLVINQPSGVEKDVVVRYETQGVVPTTIVSGEVVVPDAPTFDNSEVWFNGLKVAELASGETWFQIVKVNGELPDSVEWDSPNANFNLIKAGGGATLTIEVYLDAALTIPYVSGVDFQDDIWIHINTDLDTPTEYRYLIFDQGLDGTRVIQAGDTLEWTVMSSGNILIYAEAVNGSIAACALVAFEVVIRGDADAIKCIAKHNLLSGQTMAVRQQTAVNNLYLGLKGIGTPNGNNIWLTRGNAEVYPFIPVSDSVVSVAAYAIDLFEPSVPASFINFIPSDFTIYGVNGGAGKRLNMKRAPADFDQNSVALHGYNRTSGLTGEKGVIGSVQQNYLQMSSSGSWGCLNNGEKVLSWLSGLGLGSINRTNSANFQCYKDGAQFQSIIAASVTPSALTYYGFNHRWGERAFTGQLAMLGVTRGFTLSEMEDWAYIWNEFQTNIITGGRNV